jgi:dTDP-4-amino-4,6-dideoxygalactose transaminase
MSRETIENAIANKPEGCEVCGIVLHHTLGFLPDAAAIAALGLPLIEDLSQSYGSWYTLSGKKEEADSTEKSLPKTHGAFCILGLEERDMLTSGGGALLFAMNRRDGVVLRNYATIPDEYSLPDINAALAIVQFREVRRNVERRCEIAHVYAQSSLRTRHKRFIPLAEGEYNNYSFPLVLETGLKDVETYARKKEIVIESAFQNTLAGAGSCEKCPVSNSLSLRTVLFPLYPRLRSQEAERVSRLIMTLP